MKTFCDENGYFHIVYKTTIIKTGQYYIGKHSTKIIEDGYFGSGVIISNHIAKHGVIGLKREILMYCESSEHALLKEKEIIGNLYFSDKKCLNLNIGGQGSWDYVNRMGYNLYGKNGTPGYGYENLKYGNSPEVAKKRWNDHKEFYLSHIRKIQKLAVIAAQSESACIKRSITYKTINHQCGEKNSQFGTKWINNPHTKETKKLLKNEQIPDGFILGRYKSIKEKPISKTEIRQKYNIEYYNKLHEIYKKGGFDAILNQTDYNKSKQNLVQMFNKYVSTFVPQNGKKR
jgi:hypothetical protein